MPFNCFREAPIPENWPGAVLIGPMKIESRPGIRICGLGGPRGPAVDGARRSLVVAVVVLLAVAWQLELVL